jgi:hypothetical protein
MDLEDDIVQWELDQVRKTKLLCKEYGWVIDDSNYKARLKLIRAQSLAMQKEKLAAALGASRGKSKATARNVPPSIVKRVPPIGWVTRAGTSKKGGKAASFANAKKLLPHALYEDWKIDVDAPSGAGWRRYISVNSKEHSKYQRVRIVENKGVSRIGRQPDSLLTHATPPSVCRSPRLLLGPGGDDAGGAMAKRRCH